jgi:hypothetical protein
VCKKETNMCEVAAGYGNRLTTLLRSNKLLQYQVHMMSQA